MNIFLMADIHGSIKPIRDFYNKIKDTGELSNNREENVIIICGDAGFNYFFNHRDEQVKTELSKYPFTFFVVRGNHEERPSMCWGKNPEGWCSEINFGNVTYVEKNYPYIKYAWDSPAIYEINGYKTFVLPGAYSVDKYTRIQNGWSWFKGEQLTEQEKEWGKSIMDMHDNQCDLVLSHTCPIIYEPTDLFLPQVDQSLVDKSMERYLGEIEYNLDYRAWVWGHYHELRDYPSPDGRRRLMIMHRPVRLEDVMNVNEPIKTI